MKRTKITFVNSTMNTGGIEVFILNVLCTLDPSKFDVTVLVYSDEKFDLEEEVTSTGAKIVRITDPQKISKIKHLQNLVSILRIIQPDVIHINTYFDSVYVLIAAKLAGVKKTINHSHTARALGESKVKKLQYVIARPLINRLSFKRLACSKEAGIALFGESSFILINNGIRTQDYIFDAKTRKRLRENLKLPNEAKVIGHVGRLEKVKNHKFLISILKTLNSLDESYYLVLVGDGTQRASIQRLIAKYNLEDKVRLLGDRRDVRDLYNVFDVFVFPSIYEGLPLSLVEAQANGLTCLVSDNVDHMVKLTDSLVFLSIHNEESWVGRIKDPDSLSRMSGLSGSSYDIREVSNRLIGLYKDE
jgi:glycosyltransferase involved in cell wall biosynthesis